MKPEEMKTLSEHLIDAINREDLTTRQAAEYLGLNPGYISMAKNPNTWDGMSKDAWYRLTFWHNSQCKLSEYKIPEDAEVYQPKEKANTPPKFPPDRKEQKTDPSKPEKKQKRKYTRREPINQEDISIITLKISTLEKELKKEYDEQISSLTGRIDDLEKQVNRKNNQIVELNQWVMQAFDKIEALEQPKEIESSIDGEKLKQVIIFQRNNYNK